MKDSIGVARITDKSQENHDEELLRKIMEENTNPIGRFGESITGSLSALYFDYVYASGVLLMGFALWSAYPSYVRFRHRYIWRYHRKQLMLRRGIFATYHMPKWDKKYLQRIVIPPPPKGDDVTISDILEEEGEASQKPEQSVPNATEQCTEIATQIGATAVSATLDTYSAGKPFERHVLSSKRAAMATFGKSDTGAVEREVSKALRVINEELLSGKAKRFESPSPISFVDVPNAVYHAVKSARSCIVLKETSVHSKAIPPGWEVWWASADEQKRRSFCLFWLTILVFCRFMQDLLDMPEMPDFVQ
ncbi:hypothetical protein STCU_07077 [Strigomonas culicis]|uniref:Uncharacterized protein n=1 Tax=Strigomonas culicis TaxID=28005 RepID=S9U787_9TRYP|nr:hypothetical protein STCU_07077 [Strigomonas culicis]|eukprot:EPY24644.1 hypothetical protein STCU_07077 [Strigomonas culicis]